MRQLIATVIIVVSALNLSAQLSYTPTPEIQKSQKQFNADRFGIFIHWGIYSMFGQGEWYLNRPDVTANEYAKAAGGFYPIGFNAREWVDVIRESGARYVTITSRHHDGFSLWNTRQSEYNIVDATPFKRNVLKEFADECHRQEIHLHLYYSHLDWTREDYPKGRTGKGTVADTTKVNWDTYFNFMNRQLEELLTGFGPIRAIWFDGWWDHDEDSIPFNWHLDEQYELIHRLQPSCMVANNHHQSPFPGEDIQIFERDLPGENTAGLSGQEISRLPLETCNTLADGWGYRVNDISKYKSEKELIHYLVKTAGMGANLLLNVGPQPDGRIPQTAIDRLKGIGNWLRINGETIYGTEAGDFPAQDWGTSTRLGDRLFVHILTPASTEIRVPVKGKVKSAKLFQSDEKVKFTNHKQTGEIILHLDRIPDVADHIVELETTSR